MLGFFRYARGYVRIRIQGNFVQRFLNLCSVGGIELWEIRMYDDSAEMNLCASDFFRLGPIKRKTRTRVVLLEKRGLPFSLRKWKKRKVFVLGCLLCIAGLYSLSLFLWDIELVSEGRLTKDMLLSFLQEQDITYGSYIRSIDIDGAEKKLRDTYPFIIWTSFKVEGTRLYVDVKENETDYETSSGQEEQAQSLYATVDGTVESIITRSGLPAVQAGEEIKKGDLLVAGEIPVYNDDETIREYMYVSADADIWVQTLLQYKKSLLLKHEEKVYTGNVQKAGYFRLYKNSFSTAGLPGFKAYDIVTDLRQAKLLSDFYLPLYYGKIIYQEYEMEESSYTLKEGEQLLQSEFEKFCETLQQKGVQIIEKDVKIDNNSRSVSAEGTILVRMRDGQSRSITKKEIQTGNTETGETEVE